MATPADVRRITPSLPATEAAAGRVAHASKALRRGRVAAATGLALLAGGRSPAGAQEARGPIFNATIALGAGSMGLSGLVSGSLRSERWMATLRTTGNLPRAGRAVATDLAFLASYLASGARARFALGAGVALVETGDSSRAYGAPFNGRTSVGLPLGVSALWRPAQGIGLGLLGVGNVNARRSFWSVLLGLQLGRAD